MAFKKYFVFISCSIVMLLVGCTTTLSPQAANINAADMRIVKDCKFVGYVHGTSGWGNLAASVGIQNAKNEAKEQAASLKATHVVWSNVEGGYSPSVSGKAYICDQ